MAERGQRPRFAAENALLFAVAGADTSPAGGAETRDDLDWGYILAAADRQGLTALLARWFERGGTPAPPEVAERARTTYWTTHFQNRALLGQLRTILAAAAEAGIAVMPLKGAALIPWYYPAPALRPMSDLDLLVRPADVGHMAALLETLGYTALARPPSLLDDVDPTIWEHAYVGHAEGQPILVEYRAEPLDPAIGELLKADAALLARLRDRSARMWERATPAAFDGAPCLRIAPEDLLLHVASHLATRHAGLRLLWLHDLSLITTAHGEAFDWEYVVAAAGALHLGIPVAAALDAARRWLGAPVPLARLDQLRAMSGHAFSPWRIAERGLFSAQVAALGERDLSAMPHQMWLPLAISMGRLSGPRAWWHAIRCTLLPSRAYMAWWHGDPRAATKGYWPSVAFRAGYTALTLVARSAGALRLRPLARAANARLLRMQPRTPYHPTTPTSEGRDSRRFGIGGGGL